MCLTPFFSVLPDHSLGYVRAMSRFWEVEIRGRSISCDLSLCPLEATWASWSVVSGPLVHLPRFETDYVNKESDKEEANNKGWWNRRRCRGDRHHLRVLRNVGHAPSIASPQQFAPSVPEWCFIMLFCFNAPVTFPANQKNTNPECRTKSRPNDGLTSGGFLSQGVTRGVTPKSYKSEHCRNPW